MKKVRRNKNTIGRVRKANESMNFVVIFVSFLNIYFMVISYSN